MSTGVNDNELIARVKAGDQQAYAAIVQQYQGYVFTLVLRYVSNREDAEEVAQDVFIKAYRSLADFRGDARFSTWLYTIARTTCLSFLRRKQQPVHSLDQPGVTEAASQLRASEVPGIEIKTKNELLRRAIGLLNTDDSTILTLYYQAEQSLEEIGRILGIEPNTAKVRVHRARTRLREKMVHHFPREIKDLSSF
ncbi:sigma-70 family RNA polymerase sigma factor [Nostoc ellipsosporum NOK]|jgi:RNA polymerase sigma factor (sigma-70 family)|nr:sigma-70 family RNA polymerase sigma factor [Nostoc ellipsosporum NOK]